MSERFHINCAPAAEELTPGRELVIRGPEAHHLATVCRLQPGDEITLFNGIDGNEYPARLIEVHKREVSALILRVESPNRELPFELHLAVPLPRGDRAQFLVEKLTELGVTRLTLLVTQRSVIQNPREAKLDKLERYVIEASKQCGRNVLMQLEPPRALRDFVRDESLMAAHRLLAHPGAGIADRGEGAVVAAIGPEGGFTEEEVDWATQAGWHLLDLGPRILRVETAALVIASLAAGLRL